jgi:dinuclear metal center YbgI/SA1388 family protein
MTSHSTTVAALYAALDQTWPFARAEEWDRVGLVVGSAADAVNKVLLMVDVTERTVQEAVSGGYDAILAHHPLLLKGITSVAESTTKGALVTRLIRSNCALIAAHTNADSGRAGVADVMAQRLQLTHTRPLQSHGDDAATGIGRIGELSAETTLRAFAERLGAILPATVSGVRVAGSPDQLVKRVALCPGAGDSLLEHPLVRESDVYITADLRHHPASETRGLAALGNNTPALIDVSHWASEWLWLDEAARTLRALLPSVEFSVSELNTDPWNFAVATNPTLDERENA